MRLAGVCVLMTAAGFCQTSVERYGVFEAVFESAGSPANPYLSISGHAAFVTPDGRTWTAPLFWDGGKAWKVRVSPDVVGKWTFIVKANDFGLNGKTGGFV